MQHLAVTLIGVVVIVTGTGAIWYVTTNHPPTFTSATATRGNVIASINEPGTVAAENNASLSFQEGGAIAHVYVTEGQTVNAGQVLADLSSASLQASVDQANAALAAAQANLDSLQAGTRPEQIAIDQTAVTNAQSSIGADVQTAYTAADDAIHNQTDNFFTNPRSNNPIFIVPTADTQQVNDIQSRRVAMETALSQWYVSLNSPTGSVSTANTVLSQIQSYLDGVALAVNDATPNNTVTASILSGFKTNLSTARTEVGVAVTTLTNAEATLATSQNALALAQAGSTPQQIGAQEAAVAQAQAASAAAQVAFHNASLIAPFAGTVQELTAQVGQVVAPGVQLLSLVNNGGLKIQTYVSETDVSKIAQGDTAQVTLDAFGAGTQFPATVTTVGSAETQVNGTPAYLVELHFTNPQTQVKDGMTGNVHVILAEHDGVVEVPSRLVINNGGSYFVLIASPTGTVQRPVTIGLVGDNGMTEITAGINEGDTLANF